MKFIVKIIISSLAVMLTAFLLPGVQIDDYITAVLVALVLVFLNVFLKPILVIFTLPATIFTFGLFLLVINAFIIWIADRLVDGFSVRSFWWAVLFSVVLSLITSIFESFDKPKTISKRNNDF